MRCFVVVSVRREVDLVHSYGQRRRDVGLDCVENPCPSQDFVHMSPYRVFLDYFVPSCLFSSMSWVSRSTTACATTLVARAARAAGGSRAGGGRIIDVLESPEHAPGDICLRHVVNIKIVKCSKYWVAKHHCRLPLRCNHRRCAKRAARPGSRCSRRRRRRRAIARLRFLNPSALARQLSECGIPCLAG